jgi:hypothetical protein
MMRKKDLEERKIRDSILLNEVEKLKVLRINKL